MRKYMKYGLFAVIVLTAFALFAAPASWAKPASPFPFESTQDGKNIELYQRGDEFFNWIETPDGYIVSNDSSDNTGVWYYATFSSGKLTSTNEEYIPGGPHPENLTPHQKPNINRPAATGKKEPWTPRPISGKYKLLLIRVGFEGTGKKRPKLIHNENVHLKQAFGDDESVKRYFLDQSREELEIIPALNDLELQVITVSLDRDHPDRTISDKDPKAHENEVEFVNAVLEAARGKIRETSADFSFADFDVLPPKDGKITPKELCVYMIVAGHEESGSAKRPAVWAHASESSEEHKVEIDDVVLTDWAMHGELQDDDRPEGMGTIGHELGHQLLRLPDLYYVSYNNQGLGTFSLMDGGCDGKPDGGPKGSSPVNLDAWSRQYLGWEKPKQLSNGPASFTFKPPGKGEVVKLLMDGHRKTEYFLVEVRSLEGWDKGLEGLLATEEEPLPEGFKGGLLILHVDETSGSGSLEIANDINDSNPEVNPIRQGVMAVDASGYLKRFENDEKLRSVKSTAYTLWWGGNPPAAGDGAQVQSSGMDNTVDFEEPASNFYGTYGSGNVVTGISITEIGNINESGEMEAIVTVQQQPQEGGCDAGTGSGLAVFALICVMWLARRRGTRRVRAQ